MINPTSPKTKIKVGVIGCGKISTRYMEQMRKFPVLQILACSDLVMERADVIAEKFDIKACSVDELLADPKIQLVVNLTVPQAHAEVALRALESNKNVYNEKPLAPTVKEAKQLIKIARDKELRIGCAPDTFLTAGMQTWRTLIDEGAIGDPVTAIAFVATPGHERWHPDPEFYYQPGGGPMWDLGVYELTHLVNLLGPIRRVTSTTKTTFPERIITSEPRIGEKIKVNTPTHIAGLMDFDCGAVGTIIASFDLWPQSWANGIGIYGTKGTIAPGKPQGMVDEVRIWRSDKEGLENGSRVSTSIPLPDKDNWTQVPLPYGATDLSRGIGVADMAHALLSGRSHRASGDLAFHVLEVMEGFIASSREGRHIDITSSCDRPDPLFKTLPYGVLDE